MKCDKDIAIPAGERLTLIAISREAKTADLSGGYSNSWVPYATAWVRMEQSGGNERYKQSALTTEESWKFSGAYSDLSQVVCTDRIEVDGIFYNVKNVQDVERRNVTIVIRADTGVTQ